MRGNTGMRAGVAGTIFRKEKQANNLWEEAAGPIQVYNDTPPA